jgi:polygalacturonase
MKKLSTIFLFVFLSLTRLFCQQPWQRLNNPSVEEVAARFAAPPAENSITLWWGWDGPVDDSVIIHDLDKIKSFGYNAVMIEAGYEMTQPYLSEGWFNLVKFAVEQAKNRNMRVWIEDEGKYPSGFAGGKFSAERSDLRMQALLPDMTIDVQPNETIHQKFNSNVISAAAVNDDGRIILLPISNNELAWTAPAGNWRIYTVRHQFKTSPTRSANNPTHGKDTTASLFDYLNPEGTQQFIAWTHNQYKKYFGSEFGRTFMGIMGDEPDFSYTPWTPEITAAFQKRKGYDVRPYLSTFFMDKTNDSLKRVKADYWDVWSDLFKENFFDIQSEWCRQNNIEYIVHLNHEEKAMALAKSEGDFFKCMRNVGVPGVDAIWSQIWMDHVADYPKLASSAAHLFGKPRAFTESFAAYTHKPSVAQAKWVMDHQLVRGINLVQNMFWSSSAGNQKPDQPPFFMRDSFPNVAETINRSTYLLTQGKPAAQIAVYYPTTSMWLGNEESDKSTLAIAQKLLEQQRDFDFVDEQALTSLLMLTERGLRNLSDQYYKAIIIPIVSVISKAALSKLRDFADNGGKVIFMESLPEAVYEKALAESEKPDAIPNAVIEPSGQLTGKVLDVLPEPDVKFDKPEQSVKYVHRTLSNAEIYFFFNEGITDVNLQASIRGNGRIEEWDPSNGRIAALAKGKSNDTDYQTVPLTLKKWETRFIVVVKPQVDQYMITKYGAVGNNKTVNTKAIQAAIDDCSANGGGTVVVPSGVFRTGALFMKNKVNLLVRKDAVLKGTTNITDYPQIPTRFEGIERNWTTALINIQNTENTVLTGDGTIDGSGTEWPIVRPQTHLRNWIGRPRLICFQNCTNVEISDLNLLNHASWCLHVLYSKSVIIRNLNIRANHTIPSSDGIDLDSSSEIFVSNCDIDVNDDCISIKAGKDSSGLLVNRPSENIIIENCRFGYGHGGVACGSETSGGIRKVLVKNCIADSGNWAPIRFKTQPSRGGVVEDVCFENITIVDAKQAFEFQMEWRMVPPVLPPAKVLPVFRNITLKNVTGKVDRLGIIHGLKDSPVTGISFVNCSLNANTGLVVENAKDNDYTGLNAEIKEGEKIIVGNE